MTRQEDRQRTKERAQERKAKAEARDQIYCPAFITIDPPPPERLDWFRQDQGRAETRRV